MHYRIMCFLAVARMDGSLLYKVPYVSITVYAAGTKIIAGQTGGKTMDLVYIPGPLTEQLKIVVRIRNSNDDKLYGDMMKLTTLLVMTMIANHDDNDDDTLTITSQYISKYGRNKGIDYEFYKQIEGATSAPSKVPPYATTQAPSKVPPCTTTEARTPSPRPTKPQFKWLIGKWSECSLTCAVGKIVLKIKTR